jgi:outer membrane protein assembly factor BamB
MTNTQTNEPASRKPLRLWPGVLAAVLLVLFKLVVPIIGPGAPPIAMLGGLVGGLVIVLWWVFFSRAPWSERLGAVAVMIAALPATTPFLHPSIAEASLGPLFYILAVPIVSLALVVWAAASRRLSSGPRRVAMVVTILLACGVFTLLRTSGVTGDGAWGLHWRWTRTVEERLLSQAGDETLHAAPKALPPPTAPAVIPREPPAATSGATPAARPAAPVVTPPTEPAARPATEPRAEWPGFRGPERDGVVRGLRINTDWSASPPVALWRRPIGPGWSSFAVRGDLIYTQEQRGEDEVVSCYRLSTGEPVWRHRDAVRFWEPAAGAGPRATPAIAGRYVYTVGATGIVNALDADSGAVIWSRNAATDTSRKIPDWGLASSPLVVDDLVVVAVAGQLVAYDIRTGNPRWLGPKEGGGYSSPHLATIGGVAQILLLRGRRTTSVAPATGTMLWEHAGQPAVSIVQPALTADGGVLIAAGDSMGGMGIRRIAVAHGPAGWTVEERWTSRGLKPYFNDFVVHKGHAFGFDGSILSCIELENGERKWKGGRYGNGQLVLLPEQDLLLVLSEEGELALVKATPDQFTQVARFPAFNEKTWNHPVLVGDILLVRNGEEMAAFRLASAGR